MMTTPATGAVLSPPRLTLLLLSLWSISCSSLSQGELNKNEILDEAKQLVHNREGWTDGQCDFLISETSDHAWCVTVQRRDRSKLEVEPDGLRMILMSSKGHLISYIHR
jgi:hypothetical protein